MEPAVVAAERHAGNGWRAVTAKREQNSRFNGYNGLRFFADCCREKVAPSGQLTDRCFSGCEALTTSLRPWRLCESHSWSRFRMRVMPFLIRTTLKLISSPKRLSASFR